MPIISEFPIAGPQGKQGPVGPQGKQGPEGKRGPMGPAGPGTGDMLAMVYDPQGKATDVYKYMDDAAAGRADLTLSNLSNRQKALRNIGGRPNRNLLDNWYFVGGGSQQGGGQFPINQRGQTSYEAMGIAIDRWKLYYGVTLTLESGGIQISRIASSSVEMLAQVLPVSSWTRIAGMPVTLSALINGKLGSVSFTFPTNMDAPFDGPELVVDNLLADIYGIPNHNSCCVRFFSSEAAAWTIQAFKLELGDTQTLAYQDESGNWQLFETPDYAEELAKCRYYFRRYGVSLFGQIYLPPAMGISGTEANFSIVSEPMRITPTISGYGFILAGISSDGYFADGNISFSLLGASPLSGIFTIKAICTNRALVPGNFYVLYANPEYGAYLDLSAEL